MGGGQSDPGAGGGGRPPSEEELRAAYEAEIARITVEQVLLEHVVTLINLGMRRTGLMPGTESERDPTQVRLAIEAIRGQLPLIEQAAPNQVSPIREAVSQLQLAFVKIGGSPGAAASEPGQQAGATGGGPTPPGGSTPPPGGPSPGGARPGGPTSPPGGSAPSGEEAPPKPGEPGPAQRSGRLWVPGQ
jgi:hypothetical protein